MSLTKNQIKFLRGLCHSLNPIIMIGQKGLTEKVLAELEIALDHHELVKIKIAIDDREARKELIKSICEQSQSESVQVIGKTVSVYRQNKKKPVIDLPK
ncbi:MAG: ribosome assembly RNA-binding protein YhbY [Gammaproteobacteria bacterium]|nr:ribosome assembly RNA-binding protein YhbY [Gammaproteobacteria bacterium]MCW8924207.1 ribosome assembly RNA-binding protein YhbY [Gammaproteobacteria bacterium]